MAEFNWADGLLIGILIISMLIGIKRGFSKEILSLLSWITAFLVAFLFSDKLAALLVSWIDTPSLRVSVAMASLFAMTLVVGAMVNYLISDLLKKTGLKGTDRLFGSVFGLARGFIIVMLLIILSKNSFSLDSWWQQSKMIPYLLNLESLSLQAWEVTLQFFNQQLDRF